MMMVHAQLHALKVMMGMMTDKYTAKFKMLVGGQASTKWH